MDNLHSRRQLRALPPTRTDQNGFTLLELLVVVVILGILSAVVVFAVRGAGDKGAANAAATDQRIVRTALEVYCARNGHYPADPDGTGLEDPMDVLVADKHMGSRSTYTALTTGNSLTEGTCGDGTTGPMHYLLQVPTVTSTPPTTTDPPTCPQPDTYCGDLDSGEPNGINLISLPSGKVLGFGQNGVHQYDPSGWNPATNNYGAWEPTVVPYDPVLGNYGSLLIRSRPGHDTDDCGLNCGKIFTFIGAGRGWSMYDPVARIWVSAGAGSANPPPPIGGEGGYGSADQILGTNCGLYCGQVMIVYDAGPGRVGSAYAELWSPKTMSFTQLGYVNGPGGGDGSTAKGVALKDGRVLLTGGDDQNPRWAKIFDPATYSPTTVFNDADAPSRNHYRGSRAVLDNGDVLYIDPAGDPYGTGGAPPYPPGAELFHPAAPPGQQWKPVASCGSCLVMTPFPGGVLGLFRNATGFASYRSVRYDSTSTQWKDTGQPQRSSALGAAAVIGGTPCQPPNSQPYCGKILVSGGRRSAVYNPP